MCIRDRVYTFNENETFDMKIVGEYTSGDLNGTILPIMDTSTMEPKDTWNRDGDGEYIVHFTTGGDQKFRIEDGKLLTVNDDGSTVKNNDGSAAIFIKVNESK